MGKKIIGYFRKSKFMYKVFAINTLIILITLGLMLVVIINNLGDHLVENSLSFNRLSLATVNDYLKGKEQVMIEALKSDYQSRSPDSNVLGFLDSNEGEGTHTFFMERANLYEYMLRLFSMDKDITAIRIYSKKDNTVFSVDRMVFRQLPADDYPKLVAQSKSETFEIQPHVLSAGPQHRSYGLSINIKSISSFMTTGVLQIEFDVGGITDLLENYQDELIGNFIILTEDNQVFYDYSSSYYDATYSYGDRVSDAAVPTLQSLGGETCYVNVEPMSHLNLRTIGILPQNLVMERVKLTTTSIAFITILFILSILILTFLFSKQIAYRMSLISNRMKAVSEGDFNQRIPPSELKQMDELTQMANSFNKMCDELEAYIAKAYTSDIQQKQAQILALQAQINPHFLYNTLEAIRMRALTSGSKDVADMIYILSVIFRNSVKEGTFITVADEMENMGTYLDLFRIRYLDRITVITEVNQDVLSDVMIRNMIQPLLENYLFHGYSSDRSDNLLEIRVFPEGDFLVFRISDNGDGMDSSTLESIQHGLKQNDSIESEKIGLSNINNRVRLIYGSDCGVSIQSRQGKGTIVEVKIKRQKNEVENDSESKK